MMTAETPVLSSGNSSKQVNQTISTMSPDLSRIRSGFPILTRSINGYPLAFLDNASTTQKPDPVLQTMMDFYRHSNSNVSRGVYTLADESTGLYEVAREETARFLNAPGPEGVIFTRGTTESINLAAWAWAARQLKPGDRVLLSEMEHHSNQVPWQQVCRSTGAELLYWPFDSEGRLDPDELGRLLDSRVRLLAVTAISNVLGTVNPIGEITSRARKNGTLVLVDAAQAAARMPMDVQEWGCDFVAFSAHKVYGPTGIGVLWVDEERLGEMEPWQTGGGMISRVEADHSSWTDPPARFEAGTPPVAEAVGLKSAMDFVRSLGFDWIREHEQGLTRLALELLMDQPDVSLYGPSSMEMRAGVVSFNLNGVHPHDTAQVLDESGIAVRAGHHCTQLLHSRLGIQASVRLSIGVYNSEEEITRLVTALQSVRDLLL